jgi:hypothetical protein
MTRLPYLLPWVRVLLLIRSITDEALARSDMAPRAAGAPPRPGDAPADRTGGMVELNGCELLGGYALRADGSWGI